MGGGAKIPIYVFLIPDSVVFIFFLLHFLVFLGVFLRESQMKT